MTGLVGELLPWLKTRALGHKVEVLSLAALYNPGRMTSDCTCSSSHFARHRVETGEGLEYPQETAFQCAMWAKSLWVLNSGQYPKLGEMMAEEQAMVHWIPSTQYYETCVGHLELLIWPQFRTVWRNCLNLREGAFSIQIRTFLVHWN